MIGVNGLFRSAEIRFQIKRKAFEQWVAGNRSRVLPSSLLERLSKPFMVSGLISKTTIY